ncbi:MAG: hypothetical protein JWN11_1068, partial [Hyphomicrobiales bacterium]|nr:hypothetical protein [Hyphomicrobiales bacterium]
MTHDASNEPKVGARARWSKRFYNRRLLLAVTALVFLVFVGWGHLLPLDAFVGFAVIAIVALVAPRPVGTTIQTSNPDFRIDAVRDQAMRHFADTLSDPCIILDRRSIIVHRNPIAARQLPISNRGDPIALSIPKPALLRAIESARRTGVILSKELQQTLPT